MTQDDVANSDSMVETVVEVSSQEREENTRSEKKKTGII